MTKTTRYRLRRSGKVLAIALPVVGIVGLSALVALPSRSEAMVAEPLVIDDVAPRSMIVGGELAHLGLTPDLLAAAGVSPSDAATIVALVSLDSGLGIDRYRAVRVEHTDAQRSADDRAALIRSGRATAAEIIGADALRDTAADRLSVLVAAEGDVLRQLETALSGTVFGSLSTIRANAAHGVPLPYAATALSASDRPRLRDALSARRFAVRTGTDLDTDVAAFLNGLDARPEVLAASDAMSGAPFVRSSMRTALEALDN